MINVTSSPMQTDATFLANNFQHCLNYMLRPFSQPFVRCCMLVRVVGSCWPNFKTGKIFEATTPDISFVC